MNETLNSLVGSNPNILHILNVLDQELLIRKLSDHPSRNGVSSEDLLELSDLSSDNLRRDLEFLLKIKLIERAGFDVSRKRKRVKMLWKISKLGKDILESFRDKIS